MFTYNYKTKNISNIDAVNAKLKDLIETIERGDPLSADD